MTTALAVRGDVGAARRQEILALAKAGTVTPAAVLAQAENPESALHSLFEWDDAKGGQKFRVLQAAQVIRGFQVYITRRPMDERTVSVSILPPLDSDEHNTRTTRGFVSLRIDRGTGAYRSLQSVLNDPELRKEYVEDARVDLRAFRDKYHGVKELDAVLKAIDRELR